MYNIEIEKLIPVYCVAKRHTSHYIDLMVFDWNNDKNTTLKKERNISFEHVVVAIEEDHLLDILEHPNKDKYPNQVLLIVEIEAYVYVVPCVIEKDVYFLKTIFPSRKYTSQYLPETRRNK